MKYETMFVSLYALINQVRKMLMVNLYFAVLNAPLIIYIFFIKTDLVFIDILIKILLSMNLFSSLCILMRYLREDISIFRIVHFHYKLNFIKALKVNLIFLSIFVVLYVDIIFFNKLELLWLSNIFGGLVLIVVYGLISYAYFFSFVEGTLKEIAWLTFNNFQRLFFPITMMVLSLYVAFYFAMNNSAVLVLFMFGISLQVFTWFNKKTDASILHQLIESKTQLY